MTDHFEELKKSEGILVAKGIKKTLKGW